MFANLIQYRLHFGSDSWRLDFRIVNNYLETYKSILMIVQPVLDLLQMKMRDLNQNKLFCSCLKNLNQLKENLLS